MVGPSNGRPGETPYAYDMKSFLTGFFAGRAVKGHGDANTNAVTLTLSAADDNADDNDEWRYDNRSFKLGLVFGFALHVPGQGKGN